MGVLLSSTFWEATCNSITPIGDFVERNRLDPDTIIAPLQAMGLTLKQVRLFMKTFRKVDSDGSNSLSVHEFFYFFKYPHVTPLSKRYFTIFDEDGNGELDFMEFVVCLHNYCTLDQDDLVDFAFQLYDFSESGYLRGEDIREMLMDAYGTAARMNSVVHQLVGSLQEKSRKRFSINKFRKFVVQHRSSFWPIFVLQRDIIKGILGEHFWARKQRQRRRKDRNRAFKLSRFCAELHWRMQGNTGEFHTNLVPRRRVSRNRNNKYEKLAQKNRQVRRVKSKRSSSGGPPSLKAKGPPSLKAKGPPSLQSKGPPSLRRRRASHKKANKVKKGRDSSRTSKKNSHKRKHHRTKHARIQPI